MRPSQRVLVPFDRTRRTKRWHLADPPGHARRARCCRRSRRTLTAWLSVALTVAAMLGAAGLAARPGGAGAPWRETPMTGRGSGASVCSESHVRRAGEGGILFHVPARCGPPR